MEKIAKGINKAIKLLGIGTVGAGATAGGGYLYGKKRGAESMATELGNAFLEANIKENKNMQSAWQTRNKVENAQIANHFLRKGYQMGQAEMPKAASTLDEIYEAAFNEELEKIAISVPGMQGLGKFSKRVADTVAAKASGLKQTLVNTAKAGQQKAVNAAGTVAEGATNLSKSVAKQWPAMAVAGGAAAAGGTGYGIGKMSSDEILEAAMAEEFEKLGFPGGAMAAKAMNFVKGPGAEMAAKATKYLAGVGGHAKAMGRALGKSPMYKWKPGTKGFGRRMNVLKEHASKIKAPLAVAGGVGAAGTGYGVAKAT